MRREEIARFAQSEGAWYYDPDSPVIWKRFIIGPVPIWRRMLLAIFPPPYTKMLRIQQRRNDRIWREATSHFTGHITGRDMGRVIVLGMTGPLILSALGPFLGVRLHSPVLVVCESIAQARLEHRAAIHHRPVIAGRCNRRDRRCGPFSRPLAHLLARALALENVVIADGHRGIDDLRR
jgi:hypothetical protein